MSLRKKKICRILAVYLALNLIAQICMPTVAFALTNGPGQPEFQSFEPAGTTDMVNLFTGDFNYNIPLMTVPGPNGGYPINMAYHAGIGMEQEASWVGLGWNINAGAINRSMRGLPDDFDGENVTKQLHYKPNTTFAFSMGYTIANAYKKREYLGFGREGIKPIIYYDSYRGMGYRFDASLSGTISKSNGDSKSVPFTLNTSTSSDGIGVNVNFSHYWEKEKEGNKYETGWFAGAGLSWGSREGIEGLELGNHYKNSTSQFTTSATVSFAKSSYVPVSTPEMTGLSVMLGVEIGLDKGTKWDAQTKKSLDASFSRSWVKYISQDVQSFGYLYNQNSVALSSDNILEDINHEKDAPPSRQTKTLEVPVATYDVYSVSGQGVGGVFRPYRSDIGIYTEPRVTSKIRGGNLNGEIGPDSLPPWANARHFGLDLGYSKSESYSGMWDNQWWDDGADHGYEGIKNYQFVGFNNPPYNDATNGDHTYEPFYFKMSGEQTADPEDQLDFIGNDAAVRFNLNEKYELPSSTDIAVRPEITNDNLFKDDIVGETPINLDDSKNHRSTREKRIVSNQYRTNSELTAFASSVSSDIYAAADMNEFAVTGGIATPASYDYSGHSGAQIGEFTEVNPDGNRYVYGIPVYTTSKEAYFAYSGLSQYTTSYLNTFDGTQASTDNNEPNTDQLYSSTTLPQYAESYLLTEIYSPDYVDVTGNGPTEDDLGYYVKFNYVKASSDFKWRAPYMSGIVNAGNLSDPNDDKLSYEFGQKEIYYLHSVETKTHVACFFLKNVSTGRDDGHAAYSEIPVSGSLSTQVAASQKLWALDHISLYSKADPNYGTTNATPLKSVYFNFDYSLCQGVFNNKNVGTEGSSTGKLTLKSIYFTYLNNNKGHLSPYSFDYIGSGSGIQNPDYDPLGNDRWGTYKEQNPTDKNRNNENPYVDQLFADSAKVSQSAGAWSLKKITLPSGSEININYEADDYAYVQDKPAMQMCKVVGTGEDNSSDPSHLNLLSDINNKINKKHTRIYFELNKPIDHLLSLTDDQKNAIVKKYISGIGDMYFKMCIPLKDEYLSTDKAYDYVEGYCKIRQDDHTYGFVDEGSSTDTHYGFLTVELVDQDDYPTTIGLIQANPIRKAAWQSIYLDRPDLFEPHNIASTALTGLASLATSMITEIPRAVAPYATAFSKGWAKEIDLDNTTHECSKRPSFIRLNTPEGIKKGGGHRVHSIIMNDKWNDLSNASGADAKYGQEYTYRLADGRSSGVASYEPMVGGDEIALRKPIRYSSDNLVKKDEAFYVEEPMGESYFPAPVVGYSRVIVKSIVGNNNLDGESTQHLITKSRTGQTVYEFYTAKDYPVICDRTNLQKTWFPMPIFLPFIGSYSYNTRGFSQGYSVVLNDMHGKLKAVSTYPYAANLNDPNAHPVRRVFYRYNGGYDAQRQNQLNSTVTVLTKDGETEQANLGETYDFFTDLRQHSNETIGLGMQLNLEIFSAPPPITLPPAIIPTFMPKVDVSRALYRSAVVMKVIYRTGILIDVETTDDGAKSTAKNLMFDAETGAPLLTSVTNEFERPVYTYNYAAHWAYDGMNGAYKNEGVTYNSKTTNGSGQLTSITDAENIFFPGDEVMFIAGGTGHMLWVSAVSAASGGTVQFIDADGSSTAGDVAGISGSFIITRSGHRNMQSASNGVIVSLENPVTDRHFSLFDFFNSLENFSGGEFTDCNGLGHVVTVSLTGDQTLNISANCGTDCSCTASIVFGPEVSLTSLSDLNGAHFVRNGNSVSVTIHGVAHDATWSDPNHCFNYCYPDVLHAAATRFTDNWSAATADGSQALNFRDAGLTDANVASTHNPYVFAEKGVWRTQSNYLFQIDRVQTSSSPSSTDISKDGMYHDFTAYDWTLAPEDNTRWSFVSRINRYSPFGYALETSDALGIFSSTMYGYENTKQTAATSGCAYFEQGFDGFEDYPSAIYPQTLTAIAGSVSWGHGHLLFSADEGAAPGLSSTYSHTGKYSLSTTYNNDAVYDVIPVSGGYSTTQQYFQPKPDKDYYLSVWVRATGGGTPAVVINNGTTTTTFTPDNAQSPIDGWKQINAKFTSPAPSNTLTITLKCEDHGAAYFDDIRIQPFRSAMVSYVYDPQTHWLLAELDNRNFATFYNYDEVGSLVQLKQDTEKGIFTVKTSRSNIKR